MTRMYRCSIFILIFLIKQQSSYVYEDTNSKIWIVSNYIENIRNLKIEHSELLWFQQRLIVNEKFIGNINDILVSPVTKENLDKIWSKIYVSLGCNCGHTIKLMLHKKELDESSLNVINYMILKTISVMINFIDIAPNVVSHEPGILKLSLWLNLYMHKIFIKMENENVISIDTNPDTERMLQKMINFIERFMISNCRFDAYYEDTNNQKNTKTFIELLNDMNITLSKIEFPNNMVSDFRLFFEENRQNNMKFSIIIDSVLNELVNNQILVRPLDVTKSILDIKYDVEDILSYMNRVFEGIIKIFCQIFMQFLKLFESVISKEFRKDSLARAINTSNEIDTLREYKTQISYLKLMQFPTRFIAIVEFGLRVVHDVIQYKNISDLTVVKKKILEELNDVELNRFPANSELPPLEFIKYNGSLITFLKVIGSIDAFKYFNLIFKLKQNYDPVVSDVTETIFSKMDYQTCQVQTKNTCEKVQSLYELCMLLLLRIEKFSSKPESAKDNLYPIIQELSTSIRETTQLSTDSNLTAVLTLASEYLERNLLIDLSADKMQPIPYFTMNLLDMFQNNGCLEPVYYAKMLVKVTNANSGKSLKFNLSKNSHSDLPPFTKLLKKDYVEMFYRGDSQSLLMFYWKGQMKTFNEIVEIVTCSGKPLDHPSFVRYVNVFQIFIVSALFCEMIDTLDYFMRNNAQVINDSQISMIVDSVNKLKSITFPACFVPAANALADVKDFKDLVTLIDHKITMKQNLKLCGLCHLPFTTIKEYNEEQWILFKKVHSHMTKYYDSVLVLQNSIEYKRNDVEKLDTYMKLKVKIDENCRSIDETYQGEFPESESEERMLENIIVESLPADSGNSN